MFSGDTVYFGYVGMGLFVVDSAVYFRLVVTVQLMLEVSINRTTIMILNLLCSTTILTRHSITA